MFALIRYWLAVLLYSQRYFAPLLLFVVGVVVLTSNDRGPLTSSYGSCTALLFPSAVWLTTVLIRADDPVQHDITVVNARSASRVLAAAVLAAVGGSAVGVLFGLVYPIFGGSHQVSVLAVTVGAMSLLCAAVTGVGVGLICSRLVIPRPAVSLGLALILAIICLVSPWASPLNALLLTMSSDRTPAQMVVPVGTLSGLGVLLLIGAATLTHFVGVRRH